jgi:hypothetical protein
MVKGPQQRPNLSTLVAVLIRRRRRLLNLRFGRKKVSGQTIVHRFGPVLQKLILQILDEILGFDKALTIT